MLSTRTKTINTRDSLVVTDQTTKRAIRSLSTSDRTGTSCILRSMIDCGSRICCSTIYMIHNTATGAISDVSPGWVTSTVGASLLLACHSYPPIKSRLMRIIGGPHGSLCSLCSGLVRQQRPPGALSSSTSLTTSVSEVPTSLTGVAPDAGRQHGVHHLTQRSEMYQIYT